MQYRDKNTINRVDDKRKSFTRVYKVNYYYCRFILR